jgi:hypothetical protein
MRGALTECLRRGLDDVLLLAETLEKSVDENVWLSKRYSPSRPCLQRIDRIEARSFLQLCAY